MTKAQHVGNLVVTWNLITNIHVSQIPKIEKNGS